MKKTKTTSYTDLQFKTQDKFRIRSTSDVHLGHDKNSSWDTLKAIRTLFPNSPLMDEVDLIFIPGDWTDRLLALDSPDAYCSQAASLHLLEVAEKRNCKIRIVEGTKSHDFGQSARFIDWAKEFFPTVDIRYIDKLEIEYFPEYDLNFLYLPDEWNPQAEKTLEEVKYLIYQNGLEKVDFVGMHGAFDLQMNGFSSPSFHCAEEWSKLVNYHIFCGHVHKHRVFLNIIIPGSLPRTGHGEEEDKGIIDVTYRSPTDFKLEFVINPYAKKFITINVTGMTYNDVEQVIFDMGLPNKSAIRLEYIDEPVIQWISVLRDVYPQYELTSISRAKKKEKILSNNFIKQQYIPTPMHEGNYVSIIKERAKARGIKNDIIETMELLVTEV